MLLSKITVDGTPISLLSEGSEKKVALGCDDCGTKSIIAYSNYLNSQKRYVRRGKTYCRTCASKRTGKLKRGKPLYKACGPRLHMRGKRHPNYQGGRWIASDGYVMIKTGTRQYQREHLLAMAKHVGRRIRSEFGEVVHHIDLDKTNNDLRNLVLLRDESAHRAAHNSLVRVAASLVKSGLIRYVRGRNCYEIGGGR